jgi:enamine deaminase RidA (YjgF/YER057c/UK114 family)
MKRHNPFPVLKSYEAIYAHGVEVPSAARTMFVSGQVGTDRDGKLADGGFEGQCHQAIMNVGAVLASARMTLENIVKVTVLRADHLAVAPAVTVVIVAGLHDPEWLVEIEAIAAAEA